jgi:dihydropteroate synthase
MPGIYLEPVGLLYGAVAKEAVAEGGALPLAGGSIAFGAVRLWEGEPGIIKHAVARISTIQAIDEPRVKELLERLTAPRSPIAGVSMATSRIMGIVNVTPDSFSDGGDYLEADAAVARAKSLVEDGAEVIDIGGESTRPGSDPVSTEEERQRVMPVLKGLRGLSVPISIDTRKPAIMAEASKEGAAIINDVSALTFADESMATASQLGLPVVLMHAQGEPKTMQQEPSYKDVVIEVYDYLERRIEAATAAGLPLAHLIADPGIGFGKTLSHNLSLLQSISLFHGLGVPLVVGTSRKSFLQKLGGKPKSEDRIWSSVATALDAVSQGVQVLRVHDVAATRRALLVWQSVRCGMELPHTRQSGGDQRNINA